MIKKKRYFITFVLLLNLQIFSQATWEKIKTPTDFNLLKVCYLDSLHCWVGGDSGVILFSSNQGDSWELQNSGVNNYISDIFFVNDTLGWALAFYIDSITFDYQSVILTSTDKGQNWIPNNFRYRNYILQTLYFRNDSSGWVGADPYGIFYTTNSGSDWFEANIDSGMFNQLQVNDVEFFSDSIGIAVGGRFEFTAVIWRSYNAGRNWYSEGYGVDPFFDFEFYENEDIIALAGDKERGYQTGILKSFGNHAFWFYDSISAYGFVSSIDLRNHQEIWGTLSHYSPNFLMSFDTGASWQYIPILDSLYMNSIQFADSVHGIAVGDSGYVLKYIPDSTVSVDDPEFISVNDFNLYQNYPNPFNPTTSIKFSIERTQHVQLKVYDVLGNEIETLVDEEKPAGIYTSQFTMKDKSSGVYFYQFKSGEFLSTKKMLLLK